jgi:hypothetical protein
MQGLKEDLVMVQLLYGIVNLMLIGVLLTVNMMEVVLAHLESRVKEIILIFSNF